MHYQLPLSVLVVAVALPAQTLTVPYAYTSSPAPSSSAYPIGFTTPSRVQILYEASETGPIPAVLKGVEARANPTSSNVAKTGIDMQIILSASPYTRATMTNTFATNHGSNMTTVFTRKMTSALATTPTFLGMGSGMMMFDTPFVYLQASGALLVDFDVANSPAGTWSIQSAASSPGAGRVSTFGAGCNGLSLSGSGGGPTTYAVTYTLSGGPPNAPAGLLLGDAALPTPLPIPGNPTCSLFQNILLSISKTLDGAGGMTISFPYTANPAYRGFTLCGQVGVLNLGMSRIDSSQSIGVTLTDAHAGNRMYSLGSNTSTTGTLQPGSMIVLTFQL